VAIVYLGLGSNLDDRLGVLRAGLAELAKLGELQAISSVYETEPWGDTDQPRFLNLCCRLRTQLPPASLLAETQAIEQRLGRRPERRWGPRLIDIDLLTYDDLQLNTTELTLPHPRIVERSFVLVPLVELTPTLRIPGHAGSVFELLSQLHETGSPPRVIAAAADVLTPQRRTESEAPPATLPPES